ncbi:hypothetical protein [Actinophytocola sp. KF-1]
MTAATTEDDGDTCLRAGRVRDAATAYRSTLAALTRDCPQETERIAAVRHRLAWTLMRGGVPAEALALYEAARVPFDHHTWRMLGDLYARAGRFAEAGHSYRTLLSWVVEQLVAQYAAMLVLGQVLHSGLSDGVALVVLEPVRARLHRRGALWRRRSLGLPMLWRLLATVYERLGLDGPAAVCRDNFQRYWAWYAGPGHPGVVALADGNGGGSHA